MTSTQVNEDGITQKQRDTLDFIRRFRREHGYPPTFEEIRVGVGISTKSLVSRYLDALEEAGYLKRTPRIARGIRLLVG